MTHARRITVWGLLISLGCLSSGCQLAPMRGGMFSSLTASHHDRKITEHAEKSNFPTPAEVGLGKPASPGLNR